MKTTTLFILVATSFLTGSLSGARAAPVAPAGSQTKGPVTVDQVIHLVLSNSPALASARLKWLALRERPKIVSSLPDPMLNYGYYFESVETRVGPLNQVVGVGQKIPFPGKLSLAAKKAGLEALQSFWQYQTLDRDLVLRAKLAYDTLYYVDQSAAVIREQLDIYKQTIAAARSRFEAGTATQQDVLKAQLAGAGIEDRLLALRQQRATAQARLNALQNVPSDTLLIPTEALTHGLPPTLPQAIAIATRYRQELKEANVATERNKTSLALAKMDRWPDFTLGVSYTQVDRSTLSNPPDSGKDAVQGTVSINVPIWFGKLRAERQEAEKNLQATREAEHDAYNAVEADVLDAWSQAETARDQVDLYRESLLPQAQQTFEASQASYEAANLSFIELFDSERSLLSFRLGLIMSQAEWANSLATLEHAMGVDLSKARGIPVSQPTEPGK